MSTYLITGANRGIGLEFARQLAARGGGHTLIGTARHPDKSPELAGLVQRVMALDVADSDSIAAMTRSLGDQPVDVLINNAGVTGASKHLADLKLADLQRVFAANAFGPLLVAGALLKNLRSGRRKTVFNITSELGSIKNNNGSSTYEYRASKTALNQLVVCMAHELRPEGFCCVTVHPGWVQTDMGGKNATLTPQESVRSMLGVMDGLKAGDSGRFLNYDGRELPW